MNYGSMQIEQRYEQIHYGYDAIGKKIGAYVIRALFFLFIAGLVTGTCLGFGVLRGILDDTPDVSSINIAPSGFATIIYDANGKELQKLVSPNSNRMAVSIDKVPEILQQATVAIEDERFYQHNGVDPRGIVRAFFYSVRHRFAETQGASTITQQLLKNNVFTEWTQEKTIIASIKRKIQEQYLAVQLESRLKNKKLILENYLNTINLGAGTYGVQAAAQKYFNKDVWDLNLSEATVIAGITQNPSKYNPIRHPEWNAEKRILVLNKMVELGYITDEQRQEALADNVYERIAEAQMVEREQSAVYTYFVDELTRQVVEDLIEVKGYTETQAYQALYSGGLRIFTTQDEAIQKICDEEFLNEENYPNATEYELDWALSIVNKDGETVNFSREMMQEHFRAQDENFDLFFGSIDEAKQYVDQYKAAVVTEEDSVIAERASYTPQPQASVVIIDQKTGYVKGLVGGRGVKTASLTLNRATSTYRQPGSTFKVLSTFAPALDSGRISLASTYMDEPYQYENGQDVHDWLTTAYLGKLTVREIIMHSVNIPTVKILTEITPRVGYEQLLKFGFTTLSETNDIYQPLAIGGIYNGVSTLELTGAYAAIANRGMYIKPIFYTRILDQYGNTVLDNTPESTRAIKESTAYLLTSAMESVVQNGTGTACKLDNMPVAGKTGTTSDYRDIWFCGYTPYYTCGIWCGYDNNDPLPDEGTYHDYQKILWKAIMSRIHEDLDHQEFQRPADVMMSTVCESTGLTAVSNCPKPITEYFATDTLPTERCEKHAKGKVDQEDYLYYRGYGSGGNGRTPGDYALTNEDLGKFSLNDAERLYNNYLSAYYARLRAIEEERKRQEEAARAAEEARRREAEQSAASSSSSSEEGGQSSQSENSEPSGEDEGGDD